MFCRGRQLAKVRDFPEAFVSAYPRGLDFGAVIGSRSEEGREDFRRYWESSVDVPGPAVDAPMIGTRLTERFGIRHLIVCASMALVTGGALAACTGGNSRVRYPYLRIRSGLARNPLRIDAKCGDDFLQADYSLLKPVRSGLVSPFNERHEKMSQ
jgi:hypothetical protein